MKLLALHLANVRKFTGKRASITGIADGITVVSEANEFGKSTFFDAIHALFFEKYSSSAKAVKSLRPYAGGAVEIAADVETGQGAFRVEKRFLSRKGAKITRLSDKATVAQEDEAERWIATLIGTAGDGPAGLLWVRQGLVGLEPDSSPKEKTQLMETRRDLLSSVAGEIDAMTGGRRMDRVMHSVAGKLSEIATKTGRKTGAWKAAADEVDGLETELASVTAQVNKLDTILTDRKQVEAFLTRPDAPDAKARRDATLTAARSEMDRVQAHDGAVTTARQERDLATLQAKNAKSDLDRFLGAIETLKTAEKQAETSVDEAKTAQGEAGRLMRALDGAQAQHKGMGEAVTKARNRLDMTRRQLEARKARAEASKLEKQIAKAGETIAERDAKRAETKASRATPDRLLRADKVQEKVTALEAALRTQATTLSIAYEGATHITRNGAPMPENRPVTLEGDTHLDLPGIGQMTIRAHAAGGEGKEELRKALALRDTLLSEIGADTIQAARRLSNARTKDAEAADHAQAVLDARAPEGIEALQTTKADADALAAEAHDEPLPDIANLEGNLKQAEEEEDRAQKSLTDANAGHTSGREASAKAQAAAETAQQALGRAKAAACPDDEREGRRDKLLRAEAQASKALTEAEAALDSLVASAPDQKTAKAELQRAETAVTTANEKHVEMDKRLAELSSEIRTLAGNGIEERRDALQGQLDAARATEARFAQQVAALTRLRTALEAARAAARETYFGPVQEELKPLLSILHRDAALSFDSKSLLPTGLMRGQTKETLDNLSDGTREQIAILTRLAFARLFARQGRHMPIILDDALVYSDDDRIIEMFTALTRVAQDQQILVFSCRQLAFQGLGGARPTVEITDA